MPPERRSRRDLALAKDGHGDEAQAVQKSRRPAPSKGAGGGASSGGRTRTPNNRARTCRVADYTTPEGRDQPTRAASESLSRPVRRLVLPPIVDLAPRERGIDGLRKARLDWP